VRTVFEAPVSTSTLRTVTLVPDFVATRMLVLAASFVGRLSGVDEGEG
jgi:hypothetical protein